MSPSDLGPCLNRYRDRILLLDENSGASDFVQEKMRKSDAFLSTHLPLPDHSLTGDAQRAIWVHDLIHHELIQEECVVGTLHDLADTESIDLNEDLIIVPSRCTLLDLLFR